MTENDSTAGAYSCARGTLAGIVELYARWTLAGDYLREDVENEAREMPAGISLRSGWYAPGAGGPADEYRLEMAGGGPACRIIGNLDADGDAADATIEGQDWGTPWLALTLTTDEYDALLWFVGLFWYGE